MLEVVDPLLKPLKPLRIESGVRHLEVESLSSSKRLADSGSPDRQPFIGEVRSRPAGCFPWRGFKPILLRDLGEPRWSIVVAQERLEEENETRTREIAGLSRPRMSTGETFIVSDSPFDLSFAIDSRFNPL